MMFYLTIFIFLMGGVVGVPIKFDNTKPRLDDQGMIMDVHDGSLQQFPHLQDDYYLHAV